MTQDLIDDFSDALEKEGRGYLIAVHNGRQDPDKGAVHVRTQFDPWPEPKGGWTKENDALQAIAAAFAGDGNHFTILNEEQRQVVLGALDSLATALTERGHTWSEGERAIYDQATELLGVKPKS